jgi:hypothetical protein
MENHVMRLLCENVYICPTCFHMLRTTPLEDRKFTTLIEGEPEIHHIIPEEIQEWMPGVILEHLNRLVEAGIDLQYNLDRKLPHSMTLEDTSSLIEPISFYSN